MAIRDDLNAGNLNYIGDALSKVQFGEILSLLIAKLTPTETGVSVTAGTGVSAQLANTPSQMLQINATAGTHTGVKQLLQGPVSGSSELVPASGQAVWDGGNNVLFAIADGVTAASYTYVQATDVASITEEVLESGKSSLP